MVQVFILASRADERYATDFWIHLAMARRSMSGVQWVKPFYVEDMLSTNAVVPVIPQPYVVVGCLSNTFLSEVLDQPALREMIVQAVRPIPLVIGSCEWNRYPSPFAGKMPLVSQTINEQKSRDAVFSRAVGRLREVLLTIIEVGE